MAVTCCAPIPDPARLSAETSAVEWPRFLATVDRHRVSALTARALEKFAPPEIAAALTDRARDDVAANLRAAAASASLDALFEAAVIPRLYLKGLTLSALAYGDPFLKASADIDLLVAPSDIPAAAAVLAKAGFALADPAGLPLAEIVSWHRVSKESVWLREADRVAVDLHSRLADSADLVPLGVDAATQQVAVTPRFTLPTLATPELLAYLAVHGASSCWFRLKWIADFAALAARSGPEKLEQAIDLAASAGGERAMAQALLLGDTLFGDVLDRARRAALLGSPMNRHLLVLSLAALAAGEPTSRWFGTVRIHLNQLLMRPGAAKMIKEALRQLRAAWAYRTLRA